MSICRPETKTVLHTAMTAIAMGWSLHAGATDFSLQGSSVTVYNAASTANVTVNSSGSATPATSLTIGAQGYGMPIFDIGLQASDVQAGEYIFWAAVLITGNNNDKYVRAFVDEVYLAVAADGTINGRINPTSNLTLRLRSGGEFVQEELNDMADDNLTFSAGNKLTFNASNIIELLGGATGQSALYQRIADDFSTGDTFTYKIMLGPRDYGTQGARIGTTSNGNFMAFPLKAAEIVAGNAYVIEGQFSTTTSGGGNPIPIPEYLSIQNSLNQLDLSGSTLTSATVSGVNGVAASAATLSANLRSAIAGGSSTAASAVDAFATLGNVMNASASAAVKAPSAELAQSARISGIALALQVAALLEAMDASVQAGGTAFASTQLDAMRQGIANMLAAAEDLVQGNTSTSSKAQLTASIGRVLSSKINMGMAMTASESALARAIADAAASGDSNRSQEHLMANYAIHVSPRNTAALSTSAAGQALLAAGGSADFASELVPQLRASVNTNLTSLQDSGGATISATAIADRVFAAQLAADTTAVTSTSIDEGAGRISFDVNRNGSLALSIPARAVTASLAPASIASGLSLRANGAVVMTNSRISTQLVPGPADPVAFFAGLRNLGRVSIGGSDGNVTIDAGVGSNFRFTGSFDYSGLRVTGSGGSRATLLAPTEGRDASNLNYRYSVSYADGRQQTIQPFVEADAFYDSLSALGLVARTDRDTGIIHITAGSTQLSFRPSYFIEAQTSAMLGFWQSAADANGLAFRPIDWNEDGKTDYAIIGENGFQIVFGL